MNIFQVIIASKLFLSDNICLFYHEPTPGILVPFMFVKCQDLDELAHLVRNSEIDLWSFGSQYPLATPIHYPLGHVWWCWGGDGGGAQYFMHIFSLYCVLSYGIASGSEKRHALKSIKH